ncbi:NAD(P)-dependent alcohol dehydrogenase [Ilumatobacter nonamiensis]|uniref:NAD(P)-dependent alcohol dehydrogenase n=1 Tax=Ilumatobacter nonamiensis TaxID=467093 RepID=UPI00058D34A9|nr:NAD(P)-dependent alcohol dehydrogenase [Ilumatobacter nonamiensis]
MTAIVQDRYGSADVLEVREIPRPDIGDHDVLVRVAAAGVDRGVWHLVTGRPAVTRLAFGLRRPRNPVPGLDVAGLVDTVGAGVTRFTEGDVVFGTGHGTFAQYTRADEDRLAGIPTNVTMTEAGVLAVTGSTALQAVEDHGRVRPGDRVLVLGASGGVGTYAVQIAYAVGGIVTGVASSDKLDLVRRLGASGVIDYRADDPLAEPGRYDVIIDTGGNRRLRDLRRALTPTGTLVIVGGENGGRWLGGTDRQIRAKLTSLVTRQRLTTFVASEDAIHLERLADLVETGHVTPVVDCSYPLAQTADAIAHLESGLTRGKVAITTDRTESR